ncbi:glycosyltransferase family 2 protein [bacterium]|nr:glycosyltransferase family 2 protein [bacterium]
MISVSIIIVTFNSKSEIVDCITSLLPQLNGINGEIIIIDNNSTDNTISLIHNIESKCISIIQNRKNFGYTRANNQGIKKSKGKYILFLNPDTIVPNGTISNLLNEFNNNKDLGAIAPQLCFPDNSIQNSCRRFPRRRDILYESIGLSKIFKNSKEFNYWKMGDFDHTKSRLVDQPAGAALLIHKKIIDKIGLFDEQFPMFFSDVDLCKRIWAAGYNIQYTTNSYITHKGGASVYRKRIKMIVNSHLSFWKYFNKHNTELFDYFLNVIVGIFLLSLIPFRIFLNLLFPKLIKRERRSL